MKILIPALLLTICSSSAFAALQEVMKEATGRGETQQQAIAEALLTAAQSVNGTSVKPVMGMAEEVNMVMSGNNWSYSGKSSPVFSAATATGGAISRFQVLSVSGSKKNYQARVRAYVSKYTSSVADQHMRRIAVMPFQVMSSKFNLSNDDSPAEFSLDVADNIGTQLTQSHQLSVVSRDYIDEMAAENEFLAWDGAPAELARLGQKVGADYLLVGRINEAKQATGSTFYGAVPAGRDAIRLNWRVLEVNTGKVVAAGSINHIQQPQSMPIFSQNLPASSAELLATQITNDVLNGLHLSPLRSTQNATMTQSATPDAELTPGSSEKPVKW